MNLVSFFKYIICCSGRYKDDESIVSPVSPFGEIEEELYETENYYYVK